MASLRLSAKGSRLSSMEAPDDERNPGSCQAIGYHSAELNDEGETMGKLDGKCVLVTGASRGIGAEIARLFAAEGGHVVCAARTLREGEHPLAGSLETTVAGIRAAGGAAEAVTANIADPAQCEALVGA